MIRAYYNGKAEDSGCTVKLKISGSAASASVASEDGAFGGEDVIEDMRPYSSYVLIDAPGGEVKIYREIRRSDCRWLDMNRLNCAFRDDIARTSLLFGKRGFLQIDTGIMADTVKDLVVRCFAAGEKGFTLEADQETAVEAFSSDDLVRGGHPRMTFWDSYSLTANGREMKANHRGMAAGGDFITPLVREEGRDYIEFTIQKYKGAFTEEKLTRDIDCEQVFVDSSAGVLNCRRVWLENGAGKFRLYPLGYSGPVKIKLGRKWYEVWNDYLLIIAAE